MSAPANLAYPLGYETHGLPGRTRTPTIPGRPTGPRGVSRLGGRRVPRRRYSVGPPLGRRLPGRGRAGPAVPPRPGPSPQADAPAGEDRPAVAGRRPERARVRDRPLDRPAVGPADPRGIRHRAQCAVPQRLAARARDHAAEAAARPPRARRRGDRRLAGIRLAAHQKKARRRGAQIALIDESGLMMGPLVRRTLAPRGQTPSLAQRGAHRQKVSIAAAVWLSPRRDRLGLYYHTLPDGYFDNWYVTAFVEAMLKDLGGRFVVVWDGGNMHKGEPIDSLAAHFADRLSLERLPPF